MTSAVRDARRSWVAIVLASLGWGFAAIGVRVVFENGVSTFTAISVRDVVATAAIVVLGVARGARLSRRTWRDGAIIGVFRIGLAPTLFIASLQFVSAGFEAIVITLIPVVTSAMAWLFLKERLTPLHIAGLVLGLGGAIILIVGGESGIGGGEGNALVGGAFALAGVVAASISGVVSRLYAPQHPTTALAVPMFIVGSALAVGIGLVLRDIALDGPGTVDWAILIALGLGSTLLPFVATLYASKFAPASRVSLAGYMAPVVSIIAGVVILGEVITPSILIGGLVTLTGVALVGRAQQVVATRG